MWAKPAWLNATTAENSLYLTPQHNDAGQDSLQRAPNADRMTARVAATPPAAITLTISMPHALVNIKPAPAFAARCRRFHRTMCCLGDSTRAGCICCVQADGIVVEAYGASNASSLDARRFDKSAARAAYGSKAP